MASEKPEVIIVGAGLAGLTAAIHLCKAQFRVTLIEKETYPIHKVCGEYISNEVLPYLESLGIDVFATGAVQISKLEISTQKGAKIASDLPLGGFGISRYTLDYYLWKKAIALGINTVQDEVTAVRFDDGMFEVQTMTKKQWMADFVIGAYGKRSALDYGLKRDFEIKKAPWLGVKAHYEAVIPTNTVQLHNFDGGYCGISKVENDRVNVCYLVNYNSFKMYKDIPKFQEIVMSKNPHLQAFFAEAKTVFEKPLTIAQINFSSKKSVENHILMCGDAAGLIHPLCGNGMAMAIAGAKMVAEVLIAYDCGEIKTRSQVEKYYAKCWKQLFGGRLATGRILQKILLNPLMQDTAQKIGSVLPSMIPRIVRKTHGDFLSPVNR